MHDWILTENGNRISKSAIIEGADSIALGNYTTVLRSVELRCTSNSSQAGGQLTPKIKTGKYCFLDVGCRILADIRLDGAGATELGSFCIISQRSVVTSSKLGNRVLVEQDCEIHHDCIIYDCCLMEKGTTVPPKTIIPPYSCVSGKPGADFKIKPLSSSYKKLIEYEARRLNNLTTT